MSDDFLDEPCSNCPGVVRLSRGYDSDVLGESINDQQQEVISIERVWLFKKVHPEIGESVSRHRQGMLGQ